MTTPEDVVQGAQPPQLTALDVKRASEPPKIGPLRVVDLHKYREQIIEYLAAGWTPAALNQMLSRMFPDYQPVSRSTLYAYKQERIKADMMRPLEAYQSKLRDEHVLMDPIRERAALILVQQGRVQCALELEAAMPGIVLQATRNEIELLARLWDGYEAALARMGFTKPEASAATQTPVTVNVFQLIAEQIQTLPAEKREALATVLESVRSTRAAARLAVVDAQIASMMPEDEHERES